MNFSLNPLSICVTLVFESLKGGLMERFSRQSRPAQAPRPAAPAHEPAKKPKPNKPSFGSKILVIVLIVAALAITGALAAGVWQSFDNKSLVKGDQYQAVFLDNGQVYFGKLSHLSNDWVQLTDIYYLQVDQQVQPDGDAANTPQQQISLAKLGNELHGPEDQMFVNPAKIVFWENLKTDGQVTDAIVQYQDSQNQ